jgi:hypothetical protein
MRWKFQLGKALFVDADGTAIRTLTLDDDGRRWRLEGTKITYDNVAQAMEEVEDRYWFVTSRQVLKPRGAG